MNSREALAHVVEKYLDEEIDGFSALMLREHITALRKLVEAMLDEMDLHVTKDDPERVAARIIETVREVAYTPSNGPRTHGHRAVGNSTEREASKRPRKPFTFKPKPCRSCMEYYIPTGGRQELCDACGARHHPERKKPPLRVVGR